MFSFSYTQSLSAGVFMVSFLARGIALNAASGGRTWPPRELCWWGETEGSERLPGPEGAAGRNAADSTDETSETAILSDTVLD